MLAISIYAFLIVIIVWFLYYACQDSNSPKQEFRLDGLQSLDNWCMFSNQLLLPPALIRAALVKLLLPVIRKEPYVTTDQQNKLIFETIHFSFSGQKHHTIFMSQTGLVCQLSSHQKSLCPIFTVGEKFMVPFKVKGKRS